MSEKAQCSQCGAPLPVDIAADICPQCELRGALDSFNEGQSPPSAATLADGAAGPSATGPLSDEGQEGIHKRRFGDYELQEEIGRGGMGVVYRARQTSLDRVVAVKMILAGPLAGKDFIHRFRTEAAAAAGLQHPNIVAIHEVGFLEGQHFFVMDFVDGPTLAQLATKGPVPVSQSARYLQTMAEAVHFAHERNVLHRDLKPSNVLIDLATDKPRLTDFGLAKRLGTETELTLSGQMLGTPSYMSPEQVTAKRGAVGKRSDVYALGAIFYHLLTGRPPFQGETITDVTNQVVNTEPLAPRLLIRRCPRDLETICLKCLEKEPASRYQTAQELADELGRFLRGEPILARPVTTVEHAWRWCQRKPAIAGLGLAALLLLLAVSIGSPLAAYHITRERDAAQRERERADQELYDADMSLAQHNWDDGDLGGTLSLLEAHQHRLGEPDRRGFEWYYFWNLCRGDQQTTLRGHLQAVNCLAFSPDGKLLATGSEGDLVRIWNSATGKLLATLPEPNAVSLAFTADGHVLGVGGRDQVVVWDLDNKKVVSDLGNKKVVFQEKEAFARFYIAFHAAGSLLVIGRRSGQLTHDGGNAELWDYRAHERKQVFPESGGYIALSPRGHLLATASWKDTVKIWDLATRQLVASFAGRPMAMVFSPDGKTLATGGWGGGAPIVLWDASTGRETAPLTNTLDRIWSLAFSPDGEILAAGADQAVHLWDMRTLRQNEPLRGHRGQVMSVAFSNAGSTLASGSRDRTVMLWSPHPTRVATTVSNVSSRPVFSADGRFVAAGIGEDKVAVWDVATLQPRAVFTNAHEALAFSAGGRELLTRGTNYFLRTFDVATRSVRVTVFPGPVAEQDSYSELSPDGRMLACGSPDGMLTFSDAKSGATLATAPHAYAGSFFQIAFSPDGKLVATAGQLSDADSIAPAAKIWDTTSYKIVKRSLGHTDIILAAAFVQDGRTLVTCGADEAIKFWDTTTWREMAPSLNQKDYLSALAISPNGRRLATTCADGTMKLWNLVTHREVTSLVGGDAMRIAFSPDGQTLAVWTWTGLLRLWRAPLLDKKPFSQ